MLDDEDDENEGNDEGAEMPYFEALTPRRFSRKARETIIMCIVAGLLAAICWGIYKWTDASRYIPPVYSAGTTASE